MSHYLITLSYSFSHCRRRSESIKLIPQSPLPRLYGQLSPFAIYHNTPTYNKRASNMNEGRGTDDRSELSSASSCRGNFPPPSVHHNHHHPPHFHHSQPLRHRVPEPCYSTSLSSVTRFFLIRAGTLYEQKDRV